MIRGFRFAGSAAFKPHGSTWGVVIILALHSSLLMSAARRHSPTMLEPATLVAGLSHWEFGSFKLFAVNPPLVQLVAALPVMASGFSMEWGDLSATSDSRPEFHLGAKFVEVNGARSLWLLTLSRWACIPISIVGALICYFWSREIWSCAGAGTVALCLWCFDPNILAHGELITTDCAAASFGLSAAYFFWRWIIAPTWARSAAAGIFLGLAELSKTTWVLLFALWPMAWLAKNLIMARHKGAGRRRFDLSELPQLSALLAIALYVLNAGYSFDGTLTRLGDYSFVSRALVGVNRDSTSNRFRSSWLGIVPVPVPRPFLEGIDIQKRDFEVWSESSYLGGEWSSGGWWYYYLYGFWRKMPHGTQILLLLSGAFLAVRWRSLTRHLSRHAGDIIVLVGPPLAVLVLASSQTRLNHHFRYVLPCLGPIFVIASGGYSRALAGAPYWKLPVGLCLCWSIGSSLASYPHGISYFNELSGGPWNGYRHLRHTSVDWGQDLLGVKDWYANNGNGTPLRLIYSCPFDPQNIGLLSLTSTPDWRNRLCGEIAQKGDAPCFYVLSANALPPWPRETVSLSGRVDHEGWRLVHRVSPSCFIFLGSL